MADTELDLVTKLQLSSLHGLLAAGYVQELNMHAGLHKTLDQAMGFRDKLAYQLAASGTPEQQQQQQLDRQGFTEEASLVGRGFLLDFEKCGVHLDRHQQQQLAQLTHQVHVAGAVFGMPVLGSA